MSMLYVNKKYQPNDLFMTIKATNVEKGGADKALRRDAQR